MRFCKSRWLDRTEENLSPLSMSCPFDNDAVLLSKDGHGLRARGRPIIVHQHIFFVPFLSPPVKLR